MEPTPVLVHLAGPGTVAHLDELLKIDRVVMASGPVLSDDGGPSDAAERSQMLVCCSSADVRAVVERFSSHDHSAEPLTGFDQVSDTFQAIIDDIDAHGGDDPDWGPKDEQS